MGCGVCVGRWWGQELVCGMLVWAEGASGISANATYTRAGGTRQGAKGELLEEGHLPTSLVPRSVDADLRACLLLRFPCFIPVCPLKNKNSSTSPEEKWWPHSASRGSGWARPNVTRGNGDTWVKPAPLAPFSGTVLLRLEEPRTQPWFQDTPKDLVLTMLLGKARDKVKF